MSEIEADVLVLGGGPAGAWAALAAARAGARVVLVDKGRCGRSGPAAKSEVALWNIPPGAAREEAVREGLEQGGGLGDPEWMYRVLDETHRRIEQLVRGGYRFLEERAGPPGRVRVSGARYLGRMRRSLIIAGVRILDYHPALQLLTDAEGVVSGAAGVRLRAGGSDWTARAGAVILATGGCAFLSGGPGAEVDTGDGLLMTAEAGGELSGMEFSSAYALAPAVPAPVRRDSIGTAGWDAGSGAVPLDIDPALGHLAPRDLAPRLGTLYDESGTILDADPFGSRTAALEALADGRRVYAALDEPGGAPGRLSPNGDPERYRVPVRAVLQGTVHGTGGVRLIDFDCATTVPGMFAAGDVATREPITGAVGGFGGQGGSWGIASGVWAGSAAAGFARARGRVDVARPVPGAGLGVRAGIDPRAVVGLVQEHTLPLRRSYRRSAGSLCDSIAELDGMWPVTAADLGGVGSDRMSARQAAALLAVARWTKYSALARTETRGMHRRTDHPGVGVDWQVRLRVGGMGSVWVRPEECAPLQRGPEQRGFPQGGPEQCGPGAATSCADRTPA